ncbi:MAG: triose-phosphate isomerase, partial [Pseudomonadota bacterium]
MRRPFVAGNWKMNGSIGSAKALASGVAGAINASVAAEVAVCPSHPLLGIVAQALSGSLVGLGGQDISEHESGAFTGETAGGMLVEVGCRYCIIGHSERRQFFGDTDERVRAKFEAALACGLVPIVCVGETLAERESGRTNDVVTAQLDAVLAVDGGAALAQGVVAYEPVWAIGTGKTASPEQAQDVHAVIRARIADSHQGTADGLRLLYGGSVKPDNAESLFSMPDIDGGLIGGAALDVD